MLLVRRAVQVEVGAWAAELDSEEAAAPVECGAAGDHWDVCNANTGCSWFGSKESTCDATCSNLSCDLCTRQTDCGAHHM